MGSDHRLDQPVATGCFARSRPPSKTAEAKVGNSCQQGGGCRRGDAKGSTHDVQGAKNGCGDTGPVLRQDRRVHSSRPRSSDGWRARSKRGVGTHSYFDISHSTPQDNRATDATRRTHDLALCCRVILDSGAHVRVPAGHPWYTRAHFAWEAVGVP